MDPIPASGFRLTGSNSAKRRKRIRPNKSSHVFFLIEYMISEKSDKQSNSYSAINRVNHIVNKYNFNFGSGLNLDPKNSRIRIRNSGKQTILKERESRRMVL